MRHLLIVIVACSLFIGGVAHYIHEKRLFEANKSSKELRSYAARVEEVQEYRCKGRCYRTIVSYMVNEEKTRSKFSGPTMSVGQVVTVWAKPNFEYAYISPDAYIASMNPLWSPAYFLLVPLLAFLGAAANAKLESWRKS